MILKIGTKVLWAVLLLAIVRPQGEAERSMRLFAEHVLPVLKSWA